MHSACLLILCIVDLRLKQLFRFMFQALQLVNFVRENNHMSFILPLYNCFLRACIKMKDMVLVNQCLDLMELQCSGKNEVTYTSLLKVCNRSKYALLCAG